MNQLMKFENLEFGQIRAVERNGEAWLVGKDIAEILGYKNPRKALLDHVDQEDKFIGDGVTIRDSIGREQSPVVINESGLYSLIVSSKLPEAKKFKRWVTSEVLPQIRKTGGYIPVNEEEDEEAFLARALMVAQKTLSKKEELIKAQKHSIETQNQIIGELKPKADYTDMILNSTGLVTITQIAKDYGMSGTALNNLLHKLGVQYKQSSQWLLYSKHHAKGYTFSETTPITRSNGRSDVAINTKWTQKGRLFIYEVLKENGVLPTIEREAA